MISSCRPWCSSLHSLNCWTIPYSIIVTLSFSLKNSTVTVCVQDVQKGVTTWNIKLYDLNVQPSKHVYGYYESQGRKFAYFTVSGNRTRRSDFGSQAKDKTAEG